MKVIVPYTNKLEVSFQACQMNMEIQGVKPEYRFMFTDTSYAELIIDLWKDGTFIIVEHDVLPWPGALKAMWACGHTVCAYPYELGGRMGVKASMGCIKINPVVRSCPVRESMYWTQVGDILEGLPIHLHEPPVVHLNPKRRHREGS